MLPQSVCRFVRKQEQLSGILHKKGRKRAFYVHSACQNNSISSYGLQEEYFWICVIIFGYVFFCRKNEHKFEKCLGNTEKVYNYPYPDARQGPPVLPVSAPHLRKNIFGIWVRIFGPCEIVQNTQNRWPLYAPKHQLRMLSVLILPEISPLRDANPPCSGHKKVRGIRRYLVLAINRLDLCNCVAISPRSDRQREHPRRCQRSHS